MACIPPFDPIQFLTDRKFQRVPRFMSDTSSFEGLLGDFEKEIPQEIRDYEASLRSLPPEEFQALLDSELKKYDEEAAAKEAAERSLFFNHPKATADFEHWSRAAYWTQEEAIALSFGKNPEFVTWEKIKRFQGASFVVRYGRLRELARRAALGRHPHARLEPGDFISWMRNHDLSFPPELEDAVRRRGVPITDWKAAYEELKQHNEAMTAEFESARMRNGRVGEADRFSEREKNSLLKLVIGMAVGGYGFAPTSGRTKTTTDITADLERAGVPLDPDTVRKWLRAAAELLPPKETE